MTNRMVENHQQTFLGPLTGTNQASANYPNEVPALRAHTRLNNYYDALVSGNAASGHAPNSETWPNLPYIQTQNVPPVYFVPDGPSIYHPPFPTCLSSHGHTLQDFKPEIVDRPVLTGGTGPPTYHFQTRTIRSKPCPLSIDYFSSTDSHVETYSRTPPHVNANLSAVFGNSPSLSIAQKPSDNITPTCTKPASRPSAGRQHHHHHEPPPPGTCSRTRPGKEPAAAFEPDPVKLRESCERHGGSAFAVDWVLVVFKHGVTKEALMRALDRSMTGRVRVPGGFEPRQAYDGFISKIGPAYQCGLCKEGKKVCWRNKKDAPRHLRKFHFGLGDPCTICGKCVYSNSEMKTHRCAWPL